MPRRTPVVNLAMDRQAALHEFRRSMAPLWRPALAAGFAGGASATTIDHLLAAAERELKRLTGELERTTCADGIARPGHGKAA